MQEENYTKCVFSGEAVLKRLSVSLHAENDTALAKITGEKRSTIGNWRNRKLSISGVFEIVRKHNLSLDYVFFGADGPLRDSAASNAPPNTNPDTPHIYNESPTPKIGELQSQLAQMQTSLVDKLSETAATVESLTVAAVNDDDEHAEARPIPVVEVASAAGAGSVIDMEEVTGQVWFRRDWLRTHGLDPNQCCVIGVKGDSMYPTLVDGCSILIDRTRTQRHAGHIYVIRTDDGLVAKRLTKSNDAWMLTSDNKEDPTLTPLPWNNNMEIIGEIRWMARSLDGKL